MANSIIMSIRRCNSIGTVYQCLKNSASWRTQIHRELYTIIKPKLKPKPVIVAGAHRCQLRDKLWRTNYAGLKNGIIFTECAYLSNIGNDERGCAENPLKKAGGEKLSLAKKFKLMFKQYWYILIPVHVVTSAGWLGVFYYIVVSGIDVAAILESLSAPETWIETVKDSKAGSIVIAYTLYKLFTPIRYTVTLGCTTISINYLTKRGKIKPVPNKEEMKRIYQEKKGAFKDFTSSYQDKIQLKKDEMIKTKEDLKQQYFVARKEIEESVIETKHDFKNGLKTAASEWKHIGGLIVSNTKEFVKELRERRKD